MMDSELGASLKATMKSDSDLNGIKIGDVRCDGAVQDAGDMAKCKVNVDDDSPDSGAYQYDVTLKDGQGHFVYKP